MSTPSTRPPRAAFDLAAAQRRKVLAAYAAALTPFVLVLGHGSLEWPVLLASAYHLVPQSWPVAVWHLSHRLELDGPALAWTAAVAITAVLIWRRTRTDQKTARAATAAAAAALTVPAVWVVLNQRTVTSNDLWGRIAQAAGAVALIAAWSAARRGPTPAELGIQRPGQSQWRPAVKTLRLSLVGLYLASVGANTINALYPLRVAGPVGSGSGQIEPWWFWAVVFIVDGVVEETVCTAWLYAQLRRANRPMWEVYALAVAVRVPFHLYMGLGGTFAALFAAFNIAAYHRYRRLLPLIAMHAAFDLISNYNTVRVFGHPLAILLLLGMLAALVSWMAQDARTMWRKRASRPLSDGYDHLDAQPATAPALALVPARNPVPSPASIPAPRAPEPEPSDNPGQGG